MSMIFPTNPTVGQIAQLGDQLWQCVSADPIVWDVVGDAEVQNLGGYNLVEDYNPVNAVAGNSKAFELLPGYDYQIEIVGCLPVSSGEQMSLETSPDGGTTWRSLHQRQYGGGIGTNAAPGNMAVSEDPNAPAIVIVSQGTAAFAQSATAEILLHDDPLERTQIRSHNGSMRGDNVTVDRFDFLFQVNEVELANAFRFTTLSGDGWTRGHFRVYRRSRQPVSFLTGKEPGGMYLADEIVTVGGELEVNFALEDGYDYDVELLLASPLNDSGTWLLTADWSSDGGATWMAPGESVFHRVAGRSPTDLSLNSAPTGLSNAYAYVTLQQGSAVSVQTRGLLNFRGHDTVAEYPVVIYQTGGLSPTGEWLSTAGWAQGNESGVTTRKYNYGRLYWGIGGSSVGWGAGSIIRVFRRNRAITYSS